MALEDFSGRGAEVEGSTLAGGLQTLMTLLELHGSKSLEIVHFVHTNTVVTQYWNVYFAGIMGSGGI